MKTICIYHSRDLDGWMSAAVVKKAIKYHVLIDLNTGEEGGKLIGSPDKLYMLGWDYGDPIPDLSAYDKAIMCDISFPKKEMEELADTVEYYLIWIDHHISAIKDNEEFSGHNIKGLRDTKFAACELTWKYFFPNEEMPEIVRLLGRYDCFGYKNTDEEQKVLEFQYGARQVISNYEEAYGYITVNPLSQLNQRDYVFDLGKTIYQYLCSEAKQIYKKAFPIVFEFETGPKEDGWSGIPRFGKKKFRFLCVNQERFNPINFNINYHIDPPGYCGFACFWYKDGKWMFSLYNNNGEVDCSQIAKQFKGGGHKGAAGFVCDNETMLGIINT